MPTAKLLSHGPNSYSLRGHRFERGAVKPVPQEVIDYIQDPNNGIDELFQIDPRGAVYVPPPPAVVPSDRVAYGLEEKTLDTATLRPVPSRSAITLAEAADQLDIEDELNFEEDGRPALAGLSRVLGREVTEAERDKAFPKDVPEEGEPTKRSKIVRKHKADPSTEGAVEA
jgi:hypothetical protein